MVILITAESACILTAETIGIVFYNYSILLGIPLALLVGALTVVVIEAHKKINIKYYLLYFSLLNIINFMLLVILMEVEYKK